MNNCRCQGILLVLGAGISWGCISCFIRPLSEMGLSVQDITVLRVLVSILFAAPVLAIFSPRVFLITPKQALHLAGCGILSLSFFNICYFRTLTQSDVSVAVMLLYTSPVFVMLLSAICFKEKLSLQKIISCALAIAGCAAISGIWQGKLNIPFFVLLTGLGSGLGYALYSIFGRCAQNAGASSITITLWTMIFALAGTWYLADFSQIAAAARSGAFYFHVTGLAIISTLLPYICYTWALKKLDISSCAVLAAVEPVTGCLIGFLLWKEEFSFSILSGIALILSALILAGWQKKTVHLNKKTTVFPDPNGVNAKTN